MCRTDEAKSGAGEAASAGEAAPATKGAADAAAGAGGGAAASEPFVMAEFRRQLENESIPVQVAAIRALTELIRRTYERTAQGLLIELREAADELQRCDPALLRGKTSISVVAGCELLVRHVTRTSKFDHRVRVVSGTLYRGALALWRGAACGEGQGRGGGGALAGAQASVSRANHCLMFLRGRVRWRCCGACVCAAGRCTTGLRGVQERACGAR